jgi:hypothetical protein
MDRIIKQDLSNSKNKRPIIAEEKHLKLLRSLISRWRSQEVDIEEKAQAYIGRQQNSEVSQAFDKIKNKI